MKWENAIKGFSNYLRLERSLSHNSLEAYKDDAEKLSQYGYSFSKNPEDITSEDLRNFIKWINSLGIRA